MAVASYAIGDPGTIDRFSDKVYSKAVWSTLLMNPDLGLWGKPGSGKPLIMHDDFSVGNGLQITCHLTGDLVGDPLNAGADLSGQSSSLPVETFQFSIATTKSPPTGIEDEESQQAVNWDLAVDLRRAHSEWWARLWDAGLFMQLAGATFQTANNYYKPSDMNIRANISGVPGVPAHGYTLNNATAVPSSGYEFWPAAITASEDLTSSHPISTDLINKMILAGQQLKPPVLPAKIFGGYYYLCLIHSGHRDQLMTKDTQYELVNRAMIQGGLPAQESSYATGSLIPWNGVIFLVSNWNPPAQNSSTAAPIANTRKFMILGQNALVMGTGKGHSKRKVKWEEERYNLGAVRFNARSLYGGKKVTWTDADSNTRDNGVLVGNTYVADVGAA